MAACVITNRPQSSQSRNTCARAAQLPTLRFNSLAPLLQESTYRFVFYKTHMETVQPPPEDCEVAGVSPKEGLRASPCANLRPAPHPLPQDHFRRAGFTGLTLGLPRPSFAPPDFLLTPGRPWLSQRSGGVSPITNLIWRFDCQKHLTPTLASLLFCRIRWAFYSGQRGRREGST